MPRERETRGQDFAVEPQSEEVPIGNFQKRSLNRHKEAGRPQKWHHQGLVETINQVATRPEQRLPGEAGNGLERRIWHCQSQRQKNGLNGLWR